MDGNLDAVPSMTTAQQQMGKAKTALIEYRNAAEKAEKKATEHLRKWMQECGAANSHVMAYRAMRWKSQQMLLARELQAKYEAEEAAAAEAEQLDAAAAREVAYAEDYVFADAEADIPENANAEPYDGAEEAVDSVIVQQRWNSDPSL